jgi:acetyltransferase-like isoleucine patch superfamily enzyme
LSDEETARVVGATFAKRPIKPDPQHERDFAAHLRQTLSDDERLAFYDRFCQGASKVDALMRRIAVRALVAQMGDDVMVGPGVNFLHPERIWIGDGVFIGANVYLQGRFDGVCRIGKRVWIGPSAYLDARNLVLGDYVGWGPGAKVLGSEHTGEPVDRNVIETDLRIAPVRVGTGADVGTNAVVLPGVTIGEGAIVGAGAVVTRDVAPYLIVAGVPAREIKSRKT